MGCGGLQTAATDHLASCRALDPLPGELSVVAGSGVGGVVMGGGGEKAGHKTQEARKARGTGQRVTSSAASDPWRRGVARRVRKWL